LDPSAGVNGIGCKPLGRTVHQGIKPGCELLGGFQAALGTAETGEGGLHLSVLRKRAWNQLRDALWSGFHEWEK